MDWTAIGATGELLGAAAVVLSLVYLAAQVRNQTKQARREAGRALSQGVTDISLVLSTDAEMADIWMRAGTDPSSVTPVEALRYRAYLNSYFKLFEQVFLLNQAGSLSPEEWEGMDAATSDFLQLEGVRAYLKERSHWFARSMIEHLEAKGPVGFGLRETYLAQLGVEGSESVHRPESV